MNTAQGGTISSIGYVVVLCVCLDNAYRAAGGRSTLLRLHPAAVAVWLVIAVPSLLQLAWPAVFAALERRPDLIENGQLWRLLTSVMAQDGGIVGTTFNLIALAVTVPVAFATWRPTVVIGLFLSGGLLFNLLATFAWHDAGAGNSAATFFLATSLLGRLAARRQVEHGPIPALVVIAIGVVLLTTGDAHGVAVLAGLAVGIVLGRRVPRREKDAMNSLDRASACT